MCDKHIKKEFRGILAGLMENHKGVWEGLAMVKVADKDTQDGRWILEGVRRNIVVYDMEGPGHFSNGLVANMKGVCRETLKSPLRFILVPERAGVCAGKTILDIVTIPFVIDAKEVFNQCNGKFPWSCNDVVVGVTEDGQAFLGAF